VPRIQRSAIVARSARLLYELVADVERYPLRFGWCEAASIERLGENEVMATLSVGFAGMSAEFTTRNRLTPGERIDLAFADGPFRSLSGGWTFRALGDSGCRIGLELEFEVSSRYLGTALASGFQGLADRMVEDFVRAAMAEAALPS